MTENSLTEQGAAALRRRTRRQLLAGGAAAVGVVAAEALGRATPAAAADGDPVLLGNINQATSNTYVVNSGGDDALIAEAASNGNGVSGVAIDGIGLRGKSSNGMGVSGTTQSTADDAAAVYGEIVIANQGALAAGVRGKNDGTGGAGIGVYGSHAGDGLGVFGTTLGGIGVFGTATTGIGIEGTGTTGVVGASSARHGAGVSAQNDSDGPALLVSGVAAFSRSGVVTVSAGRSKVTRQLSLSSASFVLATIQDNVFGLWVRGVTINAGSPGSFTIHLSKAAKANTKVAWFAVN